VDAVRWASIDSENRIRCPGKSGRNVGRNQVIGARHSDGVDYHVDGCNPAISVPGDSYGGVDRGHAGMWS